MALRVNMAALLGVAVWATWPGVVETARAVEVQVVNLGKQPLRGVPVSFGQVFKRGEIPGGMAMRIDDRPVPAQVDVKRHYDDGSVRFAVISTILDRLPGNGKVTLTLTGGRAAPASGGPVSAAELLKTGFDAVVRLEFPDGAVRSAAAAELLRRAGEGAPAKTWLRGPVVTEWLLSGPPVDDRGRVDEDLAVRFGVRAYAGGGPVRVAVVVENCWDGWAGNVRYDARVTVDGKEVFSSPAVDHRKLSRWRKVFWHRTGGRHPQVHVVHDAAYLSATGALPHYDRTLPTPKPSETGRQQLRMEGPRWQIMGQGALTAYMPTTGGRPEIAPYPTWTVRYLLSMDPREKALVLAGGDLAGSWPIHVRSRKTDRIMTIDDRPQFWLDSRGKDRPQWKPDRHAPGPDQVRLSPDLAHQGSFAYVPYLVTGDYYYLEEAYFWANYCLLATWPHPRQDARGILSGQIRGNAWALRNLGDAAWIAPDGDPEGKYFDQKIRHNLADRVRRMYGPPEYNRLGFWGLRTTLDSRIQNPPNPRWMVIAPWEHDYLMWSLHHLTELGYQQAARPRDFLLRWRVGTLTNAPDFDPRLAAPYRFVVGEQSEDGKVVFYEDWKRLGRENARLSPPQLPSRANDYAYSARAAVVCGVDAGFPDARRALDWIEAQYPDLRAVMVRNPSWAIGSK